MSAALWVDTREFRACREMHQVLLKGALLLPAPCKVPQLLSAQPMQQCLHAHWCMQEKLAVPNDGTHAEPEKLVHASVINPRKIRVCRKPNGEEWLLGKGSFGTVHPSVCIPPLSAVTPLALGLLQLRSFCTCLPLIISLSVDSCICALPHVTSSLPLSLAVPAATPFCHIAPHCLPLLNTCSWSLFSLLIPHQF